MNEPLRTCRECGFAKPVSDFWKPKTIYRNGKSYQSPYPYCGECGRGMQRARYSPQKERQYRANRYAADPNYKVKQHLSHNYGITLEQYDLLFAYQGGKCAVCGSTSAKNRASAPRFHIDHCHSTGEIRGLLCGNCNAGIGRFKDSADLLMQAAAYLMKPRAFGLYAKRTYRWGRQSGYISHQ